MAVYQLFLANLDGLLLGLLLDLLLGLYGFIIILFGRQETMCVLSW